MSKKKKDDAPTTFPEKWYKIIASMPEFKDLADAASEDDLKKIIVTCEGNIYNINQEKSEDVKLNGAKELVKEYSELYREGLKHQNAKINYALFLLQGKGAELGDRD